MLEGNFNGDVRDRRSVSTSVCDLSKNDRTEIDGYSRSSASRCWEETRSKYRKLVTRFNSRR